ncbi:MAG: alpha/beta fold hydrolase [Oscillospiraceae bacterium]|jgi:pimeloyl-ACP methyl ester carboxylesterase|nr:alpha/beta fold hydrolase [Oscillospiraceae bacterium]
MSDIHLHYTRQGSGPPLLLLHGNGEDGGYFVHQTEYFSRHYTVYALDTRGHGQSPRGAGPFTMARFAQDLLDFMDEQKLERAHLLGFSDGGNIALTFALLHPERVDRLVLNGANLDPGGMNPVIQIPIVLGYRLASLFAGRSPEARLHAEILGLMVNEPRIPPEALKELRLPVLVIAGTRDMIREAHTRMIAGALPDSRLVLIPGDHFIAARNPEAFNQAVEAFLNENKE